MNWSYYFDYADGKLYWGISNSNRTKVGDEAGTPTSNGYIKVRCKEGNFYAHRIIWEMHNGPIPNGMEIDHINRVRDDNRIENLQLITHKQNLGRRNQTSKGYSVDKRCATRPYKSSRTHKYFGTACGAYMSYATALL